MYMSSSSVLRSSQQSKRSSSMSHLYSRRLSFSDLTIFIRKLVDFMCIATEYIHHHLVSLSAQIYCRVKICSHCCTLLTNHHRKSRVGAISIEKHHTRHFRDKIVSSHNYDPLIKYDSKKKKNGSSSCKIGGTIAILMVRRIK